MVYANAKWLSSGDHTISSRKYSAGGLPRAGPGSLVRSISEGIPVIAIAASCLRYVSALPDHERPRELDHRRPRLIHPRRLHADDADVGAGFRFARLEDLALRADGVPLEQRIRQLHLVPSEVRDG